MEKALYIKSLNQIKNPALLRGYARLYLGSEFCPAFLPQPSKLEQCFELCKEYNLYFSLVLPFCTSGEFKQIRIILKKIYEWRPESEIIINDLGHVWLLENEFPSFCRVWGRLLTKMKADERLRYIKRKEYQLISSDQEYMIDFLRKYSIKRIELNNILQGIQREGIPGVLPASIYIPHVYISTSRKCLSRLSMQDQAYNHAQDYFTTTTCMQLCQKFYGAMASDKLISGNSLFYKNAQIPPNIEELKIDRIVTEKLIFEEVR